MDHQHRSDASMAEAGPSNLARLGTPPPTSSSSKLSLDPMPFTTQTLDDLSVATPPIQQQEDILNSLSQTAAQLAADTDEDEDDIRSTNQSSTQEKGNGWALLSHADQKSSTTNSNHTTSSSATAPSPDTGQRGRSLTKKDTTDPAMLVFRPRSLQASVASSDSAPSPSKIDCDSPFHKSSDTDPVSTPSTSTPASRRLPGSMELPAEGAGLRGKDEHDEEMVELQGLPKGCDEIAISSRSGSLTRDPLQVNSVDPLAPPPARKLCIRHQRQAEEPMVGKLQRSIESLPLADQTAVNTVWSIFNSSSGARRALILQGIVNLSCFSQLSLLSSELALAIRIDPFSMFPREVSLKVLGHLDAITLGRAAQVSKLWRSLADDDLLWRNMCEQHIERKCEKCGWGLPLLSEKRRRLKGAPAAAAGTPESRQLVQKATANSSPAGSQTATVDVASNGNGAAGNGNLKRSITAAANAAALEKHSKSSRAPSPAREQDDVALLAGDERPKKRLCSSETREGSDGVSASSSSQVAPVAPPTRPWKTVYCERLAIERNWRRGRWTVKTLKGHTDGIMCLQFNESLSYPSFPVVITGSYDRTARIWNMDTGEELRELRGHTRGVRCLQFDEAKLITGSMDRTLKIWNWRTGALIRTLEGHTEGIVCLNFNDHLLASGSADSNIKIWNFKTGQCHTLRGHTDWVNAVTLWSGTAPKVPSTPGTDTDGAENTFLFSASDDGTIRLWDLTLNECLMVFTGHVGQCQGLSLVHMPEEVVEALAKGGNSGPNGANVDRQQQQQPSGTQGDGTDGQQPPPPLRGRTDSTYFMQPPLQGGNDSAQSCGFNPPTVPGGRSANAGTAPAIPDHFYHPPNSGQHRTEIRNYTSDNHRRRKIDPTLARLQERLQSAGLVDPLPIDAEMGDLEWGANKRSAQQHAAAAAAAAGKGGAPSSQHTRVSPGSQSASNTTSSHQNLRPMLFSCSLDNTIKIWDVRTGVCIRTLFGHMAGLWALSTDRLRLATASHDATLKVWELATGKHLFSICEHRGPVTCVQIGDDKVVSGSDDSEVKIYTFAAAASSSSSSTTQNGGGSTG